MRSMIIKSKTCRCGRQHERNKAKNLFHLVLCCVPHPKTFKGRRSDGWRELAKLYVYSGYKQSKVAKFKSIIISRTKVVEPLIILNQNSIKTLYSPAKGILNL